MENKIQRYKSRNEILKLIPKIQDKISKLTDPEDIKEQQEYLDNIKMAFDI